MELDGEVSFVVMPFALGRVSRHFQSARPLENVRHFVTK